MADRKATGGTKPYQRFTWQVTRWWPFWTGMVFAFSWHRLQRGAWAFTLGLGVASVHLNYRRKP